MIGAVFVGGEPIVAAHVVNVQGLTALSVFTPVVFPSAKPC